MKTKTHPSSIMEGPKEKGDLHLQCEKHHAVPWAQRPLEEDAFLDHVLQTTRGDQWAIIVEQMEPSDEEEEDDQEEED
jgi:hypothetical protein